MTGCAPTSRHCGRRSASCVLASSASPRCGDEVIRQFSIKNTMGYSINALLDHERPIDILTHLMIGSEGTLGFVAEATFRTVPLHKHAATTLLVFETSTPRPKRSSTSSTRVRRQWS